MARRLVLLLLLASLASACAGATARVRAEGVGYPVSLSRSVLDEEGRVRTPGPDDELFPFSFSFTKWAMLLRAVPLNGVEEDVSDRLRTAIEAHGGDAIVHLRVRGEIDPFWFLSSLVVVLPSACEVTLEGDVVRFQE